MGRMRVTDTVAEQARKGWDRRDFLGGAALLAMALGIPAAAVKLSRLDPHEAPTARQLQVLREVSQLVIPSTDTPGAGDVGVAEFVALALAHGLEGSRARVDASQNPGLAAFRRSDHSLDHAGWLQHELNRRGGADFLTLDQPARAATLAALDAEAFAEGVREHPWRRIKGLILTGYYTSEVGGSQELRFELVPGRWDPDLPLAPGSRAWSSDWTAVDFG